MSETIRAIDLTVALGGRTILNGLDLELRPGNLTAIVGPNGAGKSTLLSRLAGLERAERGRVELDGRPILELPPRERARAIAFLEQSPEVAWPVEVRILVGLGRTPFIGARGLSADDATAIDQALARTGMTDFGDRLVSTLSGGERARVLLARALAGDPRWLLADEPLTGLDIGHQLDALHLLRGLAAEGRGVVVTLHDLTQAARFADRLIVLWRGAVVADGPPAQALTSQVLARVYGVEASITGAGQDLRLEVQGRVRS